jgi:UDP-hydrolysing UDP-N-acetyl-D-glucosamine 2-epimerase
MNHGEWRMTKTARPSRLRTKRERTLAGKPLVAPKRRIAVVTGTRAEYGLLRSTLQEISGNPRLELQLVVTGMHLLEKFGRTIDEIRRDGWKIDAVVPMQLGDDDPLDQAVGLSRGVRGVAEFLEQAKTDIVVVLGDRIEAMAGALAAVATGRCLAHLHGGDVAAGDFDDRLRHAITKLAHIHFPATKNAARRIIRMGEPRDRVFVVGAPGLDRLFELLRNRKGTGGQAISGTRRTTGKGRNSRGQKPVARKSGRALIVHHPCGRSAEYERRVMAMILEEVAAAGLIPTIVYPNSDRGHTGIIAAIEEFVRHSEHNDGAGRQAARSTPVFRSMDRDAYLGMLIEAEVLVGNSSSGIIEAATAGAPAVNVGLRQQGRERSGRSVIDAAETPSSIRRALKAALRQRPRMGTRTAYGDGRAGEKIVEHLSRIPLTEFFRRKTLTF